MLSLRSKQPPPAPPLPRQVAPLPMHQAPAPELPRAPAPRGRSDALVRHEQFAEEAARAAQRYLDQVDEIKRLIDERDDWTNRALLAEADVRRLEKREHDLIAKIDSKNSEIERERDSYKETLAIVGAQYGAASKILLDGFAAIKAVEDKLGPLTLPPPPPQPRRASAERIDRHDDPVDPIEAPFGAPPPRTVTAGPRGDDD
jgi:hypothetical protein